MRPTPALLQATVRSLAPCSISPSISAFGCPTAPKPPSRTTEPSLMPSMASAIVWTILLIIDVLLLRVAESHGLAGPSACVNAATRLSSRHRKGEEVMRFSLSDDDREMVDLIDRVAMEQFRPSAFDDRDTPRRPVENMRVLGD